MSKDLIKHRPDIDKLKAPGFRILVLPDQDDPNLNNTDSEGFKKTKSGIILANGNDHEWKEKQKILMQNSGTIVSIGPTAWRVYDDGTPWAKVGDRVYYKRYAGEDFEASDGKIYKVVNDADIFLVETK